MTNHKNSKIEGCLTKPNFEVIYILKNHCDCVYICYLNHCDGVYKNEPKVRIVLYHHGDFLTDTSRGNCDYIEESFDAIKDVDTNKLSLLDMGKYLKQFNYSKNDFL